jgi:hypothetical protein
VIGGTLMGLDSNWIVTGSDDALEAKRRVEAFLNSQRIPVLERLGVTFGHGPSVFVIVDSLLRRQRGTTLPAVGHVTAAIVVAFPGPPRLLHPRHRWLRARRWRPDRQRRGRRRRSRTALLTRPRR